MQITITGKHFELTDAIKNYFLKKIAKVERYFKRENDWAHAILSSERGKYIVEVSLGGGRAVLYAEARTSDMYASIDEAIEKVKKQIKKYKEKLKTEKKRMARLSADASKMRSLSEESRAADIEDSGDIPADVVRRKVPIGKPMTLEEAKAQLDLSGDIFMVFYNAGDERLNIIYKRKDGRYGLLES